MKKSKPIKVEQPMFSLLIMGFKNISKISNYKTSPHK